MTLHQHGDTTSITRVTCIFSDVSRLWRGQGSGEFMQLSTPEWRFSRADSHFFQPVGPARSESYMKGRLLCYQGKKLREQKSARKNLLAIRVTVR